MATTFDVCIVGGGLSGLSCAHFLKKLNPLLSIAVLEARDRVGGRSLSAQVGDGQACVGGQWLAPEQTQPLVHALVKELGLSVVPQVWFGQDQQHNATSTARNSFVADIPVRAGPADITQAEADEIAHVIADFDTMAKTVPTHAPWTAPRAAEWDALSVHEYLASRTMSGVALREMRLAVQTILASEPRDLSLLYFLFFVHAAGGFKNLSDGPGGAQHYKVASGAQSISVRLAERLQAQGVKIFFNTAVRMIRTGGSSSVVGKNQNLPTTTTTTLYVDRTDNGAWQYECRRVVVAVPPPVAASIDIFPGHHRRAALCRSMHMGAVVKTITLYPRAFWAESGNRSTSAISRVPDVHYSEMGPVANVFDAKIGSFPALVGLIVGDQARAWAGRSDSALLRGAVLQQYARMFGTKRALQPITFVAKSWMDEPLTQGCYAAVMGKGVMTQAGASLFEPVGSVHWAGTESATQWNGYFEGAVQAGKREANAIVAALSHNSTTTTSSSSMLGNVQASGSGGSEGMLMRLMSKL